ncbi:MAG: D-tyrosyl-tRNA(Tyr) deacylase [Pedobacter sp.]|nr:MAG: D-tyrosyl-tRNA(Tyr) deacylase [Pedobacter sp.]
MRAVLQRVTQASCKVDNQVTGAIQNGLVILLGIETTDTSEDINWLAQKIVNMRIFGDENDLMNKSLIDIDGDILLISQFTLFASTKKGNRPGFTRAARPEQAIPLYEDMINTLKSHLQKDIATGIFGADMKISLLNDGPVTILIDSQNKE